MKSLLLAAVVTGASFFFANQSEAQVRVNVNLNMGRPSWGLPGNQVGDFYYLPEIDVYYDLHGRQFVYFDRGQWINAYELPYMYRGYDLARGYKVVVNEPRPYMYADRYRQRYSRYYNTWHNSAMRRDNDRFDNRYSRNGRNDRNDRNDRFDRRDGNQRFDNKRLEDRDDWNNGRGNGNGNGNGNGRWKSERGRG